MTKTATVHAGLRVSRIGLGCVTFGREIDEPAAHAMLDHAFASGMIFLDTASAYGGGASERVLGSWLASRRPGAGGLTLATKLLPPFTANRIAETMEQSLERLGVPAIDLLYLHTWDASAESTESLAALDALVRSGRVRAIGASNFTAVQLARALDAQERHGLAQFKFVQNNQNLAVSDVTPDLRELCAARGVAIVTYSPLGAGFLTGKHSNGVAPGSRFDIIPGHQQVYFHAAAQRRLARLDAVATRTGFSKAHLALAWALHQPGVASVLVGGRTPAHLDQALAAQAFDEPAIFAELTAD